MALVKNKPKTGSATNVLATKSIMVNGARVNNLKNVSVEIPRNKLTVITGLSGSGKSSLAFDTVYAEGQRRFVESLSSYARQFLERMTKPDVDSILGLPPAIAIKQLPPSKNPRSTVGTTTEIYDYLSLFFGRLGTTICYKCHQPVKKENPTTIIKNLKKNLLGKRVYILFKLNDNTKNIFADLDKFRLAGYFRIYLKATKEILDLNEAKFDRKLKADDFFVLVDRFKIAENNDDDVRIADSVEAAFKNGEGIVHIFNFDDDTYLRYSNQFECNTCEIVYEELDPKLFSFNNPRGACPSCQGFGRTIGIDEELVIPDKSVSLAKGAIAAFSGAINSSYLRDLMKEASHFGLRTDVPYRLLSEDEKEMVWEGCGGFIGINGFFKEMEDKKYKVQNRVLIARYRGYTICRACHGSRLRTSARQVFYKDQNIPSLIKSPLTKISSWLDEMDLNAYEEKVAGLLLKELKRRVNLLITIGLEYLTLDRLMHTLSGGEAQRINLSTALGTSLVGTLYVLDEPSIGLHPRDTERLIKILQNLRNIGNTILVVEHDPDIMKSADYLIDIGPQAGEGGGNVEFAGTYSELMADSQTLTAKYLRGDKKIDISKSANKINDRFLKLTNLRENNLKIDELKIPLGKFVCVTGVSGSGKSSLVNDVIFNTLNKFQNTKDGLDSSNYDLQRSGFEFIFNDRKPIDYVELVDQTPIGRSSRSTPATYTKIFDTIRDIFANTQISKQFGWTAGYFSFNTKGGRCDACEGEGYVTVEMQFLPDVSLVCESCKGTRYNSDVRGVHFQGKSIVDVLEMTIDEAVVFFDGMNRIKNKLKVLQDVGLGYLKLGQPSNNLSGGEAQRLKLSMHMDLDTTRNGLLIFDEPTTGLHFEDISKLLSSFKKLVDAGNSLMIIEHNINVIASADYVIDLGPEAGENGGTVIAQGSPETIAKSKISHTGKALRDFYESNFF